ncbi:MAG: group III truncated hemoglobin [Flavipsychrobacter sp.]|nr:group III truncated hemoglobin [Flavipsychrobacter sp.]
MNDITNRDDIVLLVNSFYDDVKKDETIGYIFHQIIGEDWSHHLPVMYQFWNTVLFGEAGYTGNPVRKHIELDKIIPLNEKHFTRWYELWIQTVDRLYDGEIAEKAKERAKAMLQLISMKIQWAREGKSIL